MEPEGVLELEGGRTVGWLLRGPADGRPVAWLHGQPGSRRDVCAFSDAVLERWDVQLLAIDRAGYGDTSPAGLDRRTVSGDLFAVADHLGWSRFPVLAVSMGGIYALTAAAMEPGRVTGVLLAAGHVLPYDDDAVVARLSGAEQADLALLRQGAEVAAPAYEAAVGQVLTDPIGLLRELTATWSAEEQALAAGEFGAALGASFAFGLAAGHQGYLEDGLRTLRPLEVALSDVRCRVVAVHGDHDDLEPCQNLQRLLPQLPDARAIVMPGLGHLAPWVWPELPFAVLEELHDSPRHRS